MKVKTHLIVTDQFDEYETKWVARLIDTKVLLDNDGFPTFIIISNKGRMETKSLDLNYVENLAKSFTFPRGRGSLTEDKGYIYIKEENGNEKLLGIVHHTHIRKYAPMYDDINSL